MDNNEIELNNPEKQYAQSYKSDPILGIIQAPPGYQQEESNEVLEEIGRHEQIITDKIDKADLNKLSQDTKKNLSLLGRFKSMFAGKTLEQKYEEKRDFIIGHNVKKHIYFDLKGGEDKPDNELSKKYVEVASTGIPKIIKNESGEPIDVIDVTRYQNIN